MQIKDVCFEDFTIFINIKSRDGRNNRIIFS